MAKVNGASAARVVGDLTPAPYNPRKIDAERLRMLGDSMGEFGDLSGIVFNRRTGRVIGGHQRLKHIPDSARVEVERAYEEPTQAGTVAEGHIEMAGERWVYREVDVNETREAAMNVAANKHGGVFDYGPLSALLSELDGGGFDMPLTGFTDEELERTLTWDRQPGEDAWADAIDVPDGDRAPFRQMTFTLHDSQAEEVERALAAAKKMGSFDDSLNENSNGNALARVCEMFIGGLPDG